MCTRAEAKVGGLAQGEGKKKEEMGCQYTPWAEKMSKTDMADGLRDGVCCLHGIVP